MVRDIMAAESQTEPARRMYAAPMISVNDLCTGDALMDEEDAEYFLEADPTIDQSGIGGGLEPGDDM